MHFKKLVGKKCYLSPMDLDDAEKYAEWVNDLEITTYLGPLYYGVINVESEKEFIKENSKNHNYSIIDIETNELIGNCCFLEVDNVNQTGDIAIFIGNKEYLSKGFGTEALVLLMDYGFKALNLHNITLNVVSFNERAIKCYEKIGFKKIGKRRESVKRGKETFDTIYMDILYSEFYENKAIQKYSVGTNGT